MVQYIKHCTKTEARCVLGREDWVLSVEELYCVFAIMYARGVFAKGHTFKPLWSQKLKPSFSNIQLYILMRDFVK